MSLYLGPMYGYHTQVDCYQNLHCDNHDNGLYVIGDDWKIEERHFLENCPHALEKRALINGVFNNKEIRRNKIVAVIQNRINEMKCPKPPEEREENKCISLIQSPPSPGDLVFNKDEKVLGYYDREKWVTIKQMETRWDTSSWKKDFDCV